MNSQNLTENALQRLQAAVAAETGVTISLAAAQRLLSSATSAPSAQQTVSVLMTDLRGFTAMSEGQSAQTTVETLNRFLARMSEIAIRNGGMIDKFMGDSVMVLFGAPYSCPGDAQHAVTCAVEMQIAMDEINRTNRQAGLPPLYMGVGINTGNVVAGVLGSALHAEYTVIGNEVNVASRIEAYSLRGQVLISENTYQHCKNFVTAREPIDVLVKGKSNAVRLREVLAIPSLGLTIPRQEMRKSPRVESNFPFQYHLVSAKAVQPEARKGIVADISYEGFYVQVDEPLETHQDVLVKLDLSWIGGRCQDIYAKVCSVKTDGGRHFAGLEFTAISQEYEQDIRSFVQLMIQGSTLR